MKATVVALRSALLSLLACSLIGSAWSEPAYYAGKTIRIIVGFGPGGGYDLYARLVGRYLGDHIPGRPTIVVQNMDGAGSLTATNYVYDSAPKDGTVLAAIDQNVPMDQSLGMKGVRYDASKFRWIGSAAHSSGVIFSWHTSHAQTLPDAERQTVLVGGTGPSADSYIYPTVVNYLLGTKFKVINGYTGSAAVRLAMERGEVEARFDTWASLMSGSAASWVPDHKINLLVQIGLQQQPGAPRIPLLTNLVKGQQDEQIARLISTPSALGYSLFAAPGLPATRVQTLRDAFNATMKDPNFLADANKHHIFIDPRTGADLARIVSSVNGIPSSTLRKTKDILGWQR